jgi:hypothetical protein
MFECLTNQREKPFSSFSMVERGLVKKVSFSSLEMSVVKKPISAWLDWGKNIQKVVKKL